tara:strand:+ start:137 stop:322 length:186 start_codon:yes stop_codon:yes gene_type:complete
MAKLNEQMLVIKVSELLKDSQQANEILSTDLIGQLEQVIAELAGPGKVVEIIQEENIASNN